MVKYLNKENFSKCKKGKKKKKKNGGIPEQGELCNMLIRQNGNFLNTHFYFDRRECKLF